MSARLTEPEITIGILCFNAEHTIERAIQSALKQKNCEFEIIIVDDASTDQSISRIHKFLANPKIRLIKHNYNEGQGAARNSVINAARGIFVIFFDDDDYSKPNRIKVQKETIQIHEKQLKTAKIACYASGYRVYPNGYAIESQAIGSSGDVIPHGISVAKYLLAFERQKGWFYGSGTPTSSLMIRRELLEEVGGFDPELRRVEDIDLAIRLAALGTFFVGHSEPLVERNMTHSNYKSPEQNLIAEQRLVIKHRALLEKEGLYYHAYNWPVLRFHHFKRQYLRFMFTLIRLFLHNPKKTTGHLLNTGPKRLLHEKKMTSSYT